MSQTNCSTERDLNERVVVLMERYRSHLVHLRPGQHRDIYPWHNSKDDVMTVVERLRADGYVVTERRYRGSRENYSGGDYFLRVAVPRRRFTAALPVFASLRNHWASFWAHIFHS